MSLASAPVQPLSPFPSASALAPPWWPLTAWAGDIHMGATGKSLERLRQDLTHLALARFDAVVFPAFASGVPCFTSHSCQQRGGLPVLRWRKRKWGGTSPFVHALREARSRGLRSWAQIEFLTGGRTDERTVCLARRRPRWTLRNASGKPSPIGPNTEHLFLCPSHVEVARLMQDICVEIAAGFPVSALVLDLRALPIPGEGAGLSGADCLCFACQEAARQQLNLDLFEVLEGGAPEVWAEWRTWRREQFTRIVHDIRTRVWAVRPGLPVFVRIPCPVAHASSGAAADPGPATPSTPVPMPPPVLPPSPPPGTPPPEMRRESEPLWRSWVREGLVEMILVDQPTGLQAEAERRLLAAIPSPEDLECLALPLVHDPPAFLQRSLLDRAVSHMVAGFGLTQHLADAWSAMAPLKPPAAEPETVAQSNAAGQASPGVEHNPAAACAATLAHVQTLVYSPPLLNELQAVRETIEQQVKTLGTEDLESLGVRLLTAIMLIEQEDALDDHSRLLAKGWVELARRLLQWHAALHCPELYQFDAG